MDGWSLRDYRRPFLAVDPIPRDGPGGAVVVRRGATVLELGAGERHGEVARFLSSLRSPRSASWNALRRGRGPFAELVDTLDSYGLIEDADASHRDLIKEERAALAEMTRATARWLRRALEVAPDGALRRRLVQLRDGAVRLLARRAAAPPTPARRSSLAAEVLHHELRSWAQLSPLSLATAYLALEQALGGARRGRAATEARELVNVHAAGLYELHDTRVHLNTLAQLAVLSSGPERERPRIPFEARPRSGVNMMVAAERIAAEVLGQLGRSSYHEALETGAGAERLARGTFVHQYFVTNRYVEVIEPLMQRRLRAPLRRQIYRYYAEEVGHEHHELQACERLGLQAEDVMSAVPVAFFAAYPEVFAQMGEDEPLSFLIAIPVAEGLPGTKRQTIERFRASGVIDAAETTISKHARVDESLAHPTLARRVMATLPLVHPSMQRRAVAGLTLMLEINFAAWNMLHRYYADPARPLCPTFLGVAPEDLFAWGAGT